MSRFRDNYIHVEDLYMYVARPRCLTIIGFSVLRLTFVLALQILAQDPEPAGRTH